MPTSWLGRIKKTGQLTVFNKAGAWTDSVDTAIGTFQRTTCRRKKRGKVGKYRCAFGQRAATIQVLR